MMRHILIDHARGHNAAKRGGGEIRVSLKEELAATEKREVDLIGLDAALDKLASLDEQQSRVVELRFFGGLSVDETAHALEVSPATVKRDWSCARAWLLRELGGDTLGRGASRLVAGGIAA